VIVASFFAPRPEHPRWRDYLPGLHLLQASCDRLGLRHVVIGDEPVEGFDVLSVPDLPRLLMPAFVTGQRHAIETLDDDLLLVGADCVIAKRPDYPLEIADIAVTLGDFWDCQLNTGAIWIARAARGIAAEMWRAAEHGIKDVWGDDQIAICRQFEPLPDLRTLPTIQKRGSVRVAYLPVDPWNLAPVAPADDCSHAVVLHFRGNRKEWAAEWCERWIDLRP
jgi:hypothetical protein